MAEETDNSRQLAHALARACLGINILFHGLSRMPHLAAFISKLEHQFADTFLPRTLVDASGYVIVFGEALVGLLVLIGLRLRAALIAGLLLMLLLQFGSALVQDWSAAGLQLPYVGLYAALLATLRWDRYSIDRWGAKP